MVKTILLILCFFFHVRGIYEVPGKIYFQDNFEYGLTYAADSIKPGNTKIHFIETPQSYEWPDSGWGLLQPDFKDYCDTFHYKKKSGLILKNISGIRISHPRFSKMAFSSLKKWNEADPGQSITADRAIHGNFSLTVKGQKFGHSFISCPFNWGSSWIRFYIRIPFETISRIKSDDYIAFLEIYGQNTNNPFRLGVYKDSDDSNFFLICGLKSSMETNNKNKTGKISGSAFQADIEQCIEIHCQGQNSSCGNFTIYNNGDSIMNFSIPDTFNFGNLQAFSPGLHRDSAGIIYFDDFIISGNRQDMITDINKFAGKRINKKSLMSPRIKVQFQFADKDQWLSEPGNRVFDPLNHNTWWYWCTLMDDRHWKWLRIRAKSLENSWSSWSSPIPIEELPQRGFPQIKEKIHNVEIARLIYNLKIMDLKMQKEVTFLKPGLWYTLFMNVDFNLLIADHLVAKFYLHPFNAPLSINTKEANIYNSRNSYFFMLDFFSKKISVGLRENSNKSISTYNQKCDFIDGRFASFIIDSLNKTAQVNFRLLDNAEKGPWLMEYRMLNKASEEDYLVSRFMSKLFIVGEASTNKDYSFKRNLILFLALAFFILGLIMVLLFTKRVDRLKKTSFKIKQNYHPAVKKIIEHISENIQSHLNIQNLAEITNLSRGYLSQLFKNETGENLLDFINRKKIEQAGKMLENTNYTVNEVAYKLGFKHPSNFNRTFKRYFGIAPKAFRKSEK
ncbi:MAG: AraC family transcriptional regulator [bacterium]